MLRFLAKLFEQLTKLRNTLFDLGILNQYNAKIKIISIGNLSVGGTGKTPHVAFISRILNEHKIAIISRGYRRKQKGLIVAELKKHTSKDIGDEPLELLSNLDSSRVTVVVEKRRKKAVKFIQNNFPDIKLALLDDGFQHRYLKRDLNILLTDYNNPFFDDTLLPKGRLRESKSSASRADIIIVTKCSKDLSKNDQKAFVSRCSEYSNATTLFSKIEYNKLLDTQNKSVQLDPKKKYLLITGIANPNPIYDYLRVKNIHFAAIKHADHHDFTKKDLNYIIKKSESCDAILTTEKDWMRLKNTSILNRISIELFRLQIEIKFVDSNQDNIFNNHIQSLLK